MVLKVVYIGLIIIITLWTIYLYINHDQEYKNEIRRITMIESKTRRHKDILNNYRLNSIPCHIPNLENPRDCYMGSNYNCKWSEHADRCNQLK